MKKSVLLLAALVLFLAGRAQDGVSITHQLPVEVAAGITFEADFKINKGSVSGFAKFQADLPTGYTATNIESKGGNFTFENQRVKIVWVAVPAEAEFEIKMQITVPAEASGSFAITPKFYYLESSVKKEAEMPTHNIRISERGDVATTPVETNTVETTPVETVETNTVETTPVETVETNTVETTPVETTPVETNTVVTTPVETTPVETNTVATTPTNTVTTTPTNSVSTGAVYKVQLGAFSNRPDKSKFPGANVTIVEEGGYYKALSGKFNSLEEAQAHRQKLISKGYDCFIAIYENGVRTGAVK